MQTGAIERIGLHTGIDDMTLSVDGQTRTYIGAGNMLTIPEFVYSMGLEYEVQEMSFAILSPEIHNLIRAYQSENGKIEIHCAFFNRPDMSLVGTSAAFKGFMTQAVIEENETEMSATIGIESGIRNGTRTSVLMRSDESQKLRDPDDTAFEYAAISASVPVIWGQGKGYQTPGWSSR